MRRLGKFIGGLLFVLVMVYVLLRQPWKGSGRLDELPTSVYEAFGPPRAVTIKGYDDDAMEPFISRDGRYLFWNNLNHSSVNTNLYFARRAGGPYSFVFGGEVAGVNTEKLDGVASMTTDGTLFYTSMISYKPKKGHYGSLYWGPFADGSVAGAQKVSGTVDRDEFGWLNMDCEVTADGSEIYISDSYFQMYRPPPRKANIRRALRVAKGRYERVGDDDPIMAEVNTSCLEYAPCISVDKLELFFSRTYIPGWFGKKRGKTQLLICRASRKSVAEPFSNVQLVGAIHQDAVGSGSVGAELVAGGLSADKLFVEAPSLSSDGRYLYYHKRVGKKFQVWCTERAAP